MLVSPGALRTLPRRQELDLAGAPKLFPHLSIHRRTESPPTLVTSALLARLPRGHRAPSAWPSLLASGNQRPKGVGRNWTQPVSPYASMPRIQTVQVASYSHPLVPDCLATRQLPNPGCWPCLRATTGAREIQGASRNGAHTKSLSLFPHPANNDSPGRLLPSATQRPWLLATQRLPNR